MDAVCERFGRSDNLVSNAAEQHPQKDASYKSGQVLHPNGGTIIND